MLRPRYDARESVSFRLEPKTKRELDRQARLLHVTSGELCRSVMERHLARDDLRVVLDAITEVGSRQDAMARALEEALSGVEEEVAGLRRDFDRALRAAR